MNDRADGAADAGERRRAVGAAIQRSAKMAAFLAATNLLLARRAERQHPPTGRILKLGSAHVHCREQGDGPPVVLLHGTGSLMQDFELSGLVARLAQAHRVILFDRPGYGHSTRPSDRSWTPEIQAELLAEATDRIGAANPVVVGHSFGTLVAIAWALQRPKDVAALGLLAGYFYPTWRPDSRIQTLATLPLVEDFFSWTSLPMQARLAAPLLQRLQFTPARPTDSFRTGMPHGLLRRPRQLQASAEDGAQLPSAARRLSRHYGKLNMPVLVAWGAGDCMVIQDKQSQKLVTDLSQVESLCIPGSGHMVHHSATTAIARAIRQLGARANHDASDGNRQLDDLPLRPIESGAPAAPSL